MSAPTRPVVVVVVVMVCCVFLPLCTQVSSSPMRPEVNGKRELADDTSPLECMKCQPGTFATKPCFHKTSTVCQPCPDNTFSSLPNLDTQCQPCSSCPDGFFQIEACTRKSDTVCESRDTAVMDMIQGDDPTTYHHHVNPTHTSHDVKKDNLVKESPSDVSEGAGAKLEDETTGEKQPEEVKLAASEDGMGGGGGEGAEMEGGEEGSGDGEVLLVTDVVTDTNVEGAIPPPSHPTSPSEPKPTASDNSVMAGEGEASSINHSEDADKENNKENDDGIVGPDADEKDKENEENDEENSDDSTVHGDDSGETRDKDTLVTTPENPSAQLSPEAETENLVMGQSQDDTKEDKTTAVESPPDDDVHDHDEQDVHDHDEQDVHDQPLPFDHEGDDEESAAESEPTSEAAANDNNGEHAPESEHSVEAKNDTDSNKDIPESEPVAQPAEETDETDDKTGGILLPIEPTQDHDNDHDHDHHEDKVTSPEPAGDDDVGKTDDDESQIPAESSPQSTSPTVFPEGGEDEEETEVTPSPEHAEVEHVDTNSDITETADTLPDDADNDEHELAEGLETAASLSLANDTKPSEEDERDAQPEDTAEENGESPVLTAVSDLGLHSAPSDHNTTVVDEDVEDGGAAAETDEVDLGDDVDADEDNDDSPVLDEEENKANQTGDNVLVPAHGVADSDDDDDGDHDDDEDNDDMTTADPESPVLDIIKTSPHPHAEDDDKQDEDEDTEVKVDSVLSPPVVDQDTHETTIPTPESSNNETDHDTHIPILIPPSAEDEDHVHGLEMETEAQNETESVDEVHIAADTKHEHDEHTETEDDDQTTQPAKEPQVSPTDAQPTLKEDEDQDDKVMILPSSPSSAPSSTQRIPTLEELEGDDQGSGDLPGIVVDLDKEHTHQTDHNVTTGDTEHVDDLEKTDSKITEGTDGEHPMEGEKTQLEADHNVTEGIEEEHVTEGEKTDDITDETEEPHVIEGEKTDNVTEGTEEDHAMEGEKVDLSVSEVEDSEHNVTEDRQIEGRVNVVIGVHGDHEEEVARPPPHVPEEDTRKGEGSHVVIGDGDTDGGDTEEKEDEQGQGAEGEEGEEAEETEIEEIEESEETLEIEPAKQGGDTQEDVDGKRRTAIIVGVAVGGVALFCLGFVLSRYCRKRGAFKVMKKVPQDNGTTNGNTESIEFRPVRSASGIYDEVDEVGPPGNQGSYKKLPEQGYTPVATSPALAPVSITPTTLTTFTTAPNGDTYAVVNKRRYPPSEIHAVHDPHVNGIDQIKYIDETTDDEGGEPTPHDRLLPPSRPLHATLPEVEEEESRYKPPEPETRPPASSFSGESQTSLSTDVLRHVEQGSAMVNGGGSEGLGSEESEKEEEGKKEEGSKEAEMAPPPKGMGNGSVEYPIAIENGVALC